MELYLIIGPMKSGKSFDLISFFAPLKYTNEQFAVFHSSKNVRDETVFSRSGINIESRKINSLFDIKENYTVVGIDEIHMFDEKDVDALREMLQFGTKVVVSGLDTDYRGKMFPIIKRIFELVPKDVRYKMAVCEICKNHNAVYTQVLLNGEPILDGMPSVIPEDGTYQYKSVCRRCFIGQ